MNVIKIILSALLLGCLMKMSYGYYQFVRMAALIGFAAIAYNAFSRKAIIEAIIAVALAILFQPFSKVVMKKDIWVMVDICAAGLLILSIVVPYIIKQVNRRRSFRYID